MKKIVLIFFFLFSVITMMAQKGGYGWYLGRNWSFFRPGLSNISTQCQYYNYRLGTDIKYKNVSTGNMFGAFMLFGHWQTELWWIGRYDRHVSDYLDPTSSLPRTIGIKTRYNSLIWGNALRVDIFSLGFGLEMADLKIMAKDAPEDDFGKAKWDRTFMGKEISLGPLFPSSPGFMFYFDVMPKYFGFRAYYSIPMGDVSFENRGTLTFYEFYPANWGFCLYLNYQMLEDL